MKWWNENSFIKQKREGSTLVSVLIGVLFLAAIGVIVLTVANQYMISVNVDHNSSNNFYEAEGILEEVKTGLLEYAGESSENAYRDVLQNYTKDKNTKREAFSQKYLTLLASKLLTNSYTWDDAKIGKFQECNIDNIKSLSQKPEAVTVIKNKKAGFVIKRDSSTGEYSLVICNVMIDYTNDVDYRSSIQTDICMTVPDYSLEGNSTFDEMKDYISISDDMFRVHDYQKNNTVTGNVYTGNREEGIVCGLESGVSFNGATIISRGDLKVHNGANVTLQGEDGAGDLYVKNIHLTGDKDSTLQTQLAFNENAYVANDLNIETNNATVTLGGRYYGYSYNQKNDMASGTTSSDYSSAILINAKNTTLKTGGLDASSSEDDLKTLILAGRAFVSRGKDNNNAGAAKTVSDIMTGESIAVKSNQLAYLVPDDYIVNESGTSGVYQNPVGKDDISNVHIDVTNLRNDLGAYLADGNKPYEENYSNTGDYVFFYLKFKDGNAANKYFENYYGTTSTDEDGNEINNKADLTEKGRVYISNEDISLKADPMLYLVAGNALNNYYAEGGAGLQTSTYFGSNQQANKELLEEGKRIGQTYVGLQLGLTPSENPTGAMRLPLLDADNKEIAPPKVVAEKIIDFSKMAGGAITKDESETGVSGSVLKIVKGSYTVGTKTTGLLIVDGDVTVKNDFTGLILATGKVQVESGSLNLQSDMVTVGKLFDYIRTDATLANMFRELNGTSVKRPAKLEDCLTYQNWVKNNA